mmetsp:Transcript_51491/g.164659  ORF Transcript_51491/g.164659 Transcript_51491/m.164659 type:complete len:331 (-) Transcript_51491:1309-2301(-)
MRQPGLLERRRGRPPGRLHLLHGQKDPLLQRQPRGVQRPHQLQRGVTQTPHRLGEAREVQGAAAGRLDAALRLPGPLPPLLVAEDDAEALPHPPVRARRHGGAAQGGRGLAVVGGAQAVLQGGVAGAPHQVALLHPRAVDRSFREAQLDLLHAPGDGLALLRHLSEAPPLGVEKLEDGAALLVLLGQPAIEYHPVIEQCTIFGSAHGLAGGGGRRRGLDEQGLRGTLPTHPSPRLRGAATSTTTPPWRVTHTTSPTSVPLCLGARPRTSSWCCTPSMKPIVRPRCSASCPRAKTSSSSRRSSGLRSPAPPLTLAAFSPVSSSHAASTARR